jgi:KaiC/GvpD/RAD55 family RecA-like ATPase
MLWGKIPYCPMAVQAPGRMPTGISSLDPMLDGGVPPGSVVLLEGEIGAGSQEFVYTSLIYLSMLQQRGEGGPGARVPDSISYITFTRLREDILKEITLSFAPNLVQSVNGTLSFTDLSTHYFDSSVVPSDWYCIDGSDECEKKRNASPEKMLSDLSTHIANPGRKNTLLKLLYLTLSVANPKKGKKEGGSSLVVLDSLTDLATQYSEPERWKELTAFLRGLQRVSKVWNATVYLLLTKGVLDPAREKEIADCVDAVVLFKWEETVAHRRQRTMFFEKFRGVMPHLEERDLVKFAVKISPGSGFEVSNIRVVV